MALQFAGAVSDRVDIGSGTAIDNVATGALLLWVYVDSYTSARRFYQKRVSSTQRFDLFFLTAGGQPCLQFFMACGTANGQIQGDLANFAAYGTGKWLCIAALFAHSGAAGDQKLLMGDLTTPLAEPSAYRAQVVPTGTQGDDSSVSGIIGNDSSSTLSMTGRIAHCQIISGTAVSNALAQSWQFRPRYLSGTVAMHVLGANGTGTQPDWSGNGNAGTVTGATAVGHVPITPWFGWDAALPYAAAAAATVYGVRGFPRGMFHGMSRRVDVGRIGQ